MVIGSLPAEDMALLLRAGAVLALGTWLVRPALLRLVPGGQGWISALICAWAVTGWTPWMLSALGLVPFGAAPFSGLVVLALSRLVVAGDRSPNMSWQGALALAASFVVLFWFGLAQRLGQPDLSGLEKFTDTGFLAADMRADWMPPPDAWYAGEPVNYYYIGQAMAASWGRIVGARPDTAYQIAMAMLFALTGLAVWRLTVELTEGYGRRLAHVLGGVAGLLTLYGGNLHSVLYTLFRRWMPAGNEAFYFPDSTRFIGFDPPTADKAFTEFPAYAFAVGDLHAHVAATPVFLLGLLVVVSLLRRSLNGAAPSLATSALLGWLLGLLAAINAWDVAILGLIALVAGLVLALRPGAPGAAALIRLDALGAAAVTVLAVAFVTAAPFLGHFTAFAKGLEAAPAHSPLWQLAVLYGHVLPASLLFVLALVFRKSGAAESIPTAMLLVSALLLIALPEMLTLRDIYGLDFARANTMFKLSFRAQTLLIVAGLAALAPALASTCKGWFSAALVAAVPIVATLAYAPYIFQPPSVIRGLDGRGFLGAERTLVEAAEGLPLARGEAFIEASGDAFGKTARVSAMTGQPVVIGWAGHEWLWRGDGPAAMQRAEDVRRFYTTQDPGERCRIIRRYNIRYVILGVIEKETYPDLDQPALLLLGPAIHESAGGRIVQIPAGACKPPDTE